VNESAASAVLSEESLDAFVAALPKAELHIHLEGSVSEATLMDLARKHGERLPFEDTKSLYDFPDLAAFLRIYDIVSRLIRDEDDFRRVAFETLERVAKAKGRYVELFFSPQVHAQAGVSYKSMLDGLVAGMREAERAFGIQGRLLPANNRELGAIEGERFLDMVLSDRRPEIIGIGMDYQEVDPRPFASMYARARDAGLRATVHVGDKGPAAHVRYALDLLGCDRVDHGYHVLDDEALLERCYVQRVPFGTCPTSSTYVTRWTDLASPDHAIRRMIQAGLCVTLNTDDPGLFRIDLNDEYRIAARQMDATLAELKQLSLNGIQSSWLSKADKDLIVRSWSAEIDALIQAATA
jgi:adenosine deaminase